MPTEFLSIFQHTLALYRHDLEMIKVQKACCYIKLFNAKQWG